MCREESKSVGAYVMTNRNVKWGTKKNRQQHDARKMLVTLKINTRVAFNYRLLHMCMLLLSFVFFFCWYVEYQWGIYGATVRGLYTWMIRTLWRCVCVFFIHALSSRNRGIIWIFVSFMFCLLFFFYSLLLLLLHSSSLALFLFAYFFFLHTRTKEEYRREKKMLMDSIWLYVSIGFFK